MADQYTKSWIIEHAVPIIQGYNNLTLRALHYRLVAVHGMTNTLNHYKRVINAMTAARWDGAVAFDDFVDHDRDTLGSTKFEETILEDKVAEAETQIEAWMTSYGKNRWENQPKYVEVFIEKKALQGVFQGPCQRLSVALSPCKGYPSLTYLYDAMERLNYAHALGKQVVILYYGDHDPSGDDIPRSMADNWERMGLGAFELKRKMLTKEQVIEMGLPPAPIKRGDSRSASWDGLGQVELDAVDPHDLEKIVRADILEEFDLDLHNDLMDLQATERDEFQGLLKEFVKTL